MLTLDKIYHAAYALNDVVRKTTLVRAPKLNPECDVYLKTENLQVTGSFKVRGAGYMISQLTEEEKAKGVIACSAGNHAQGTADPTAEEQTVQHDDAEHVVRGGLTATGQGVLQSAQRAST